jgi:hypothetical protein
MADYKRKLKYIRFPEIRGCIFCGDPELTGEHIFPKWSHQYLPDDEGKNYQSLRGIQGPRSADHHVINKSGDIRHWKVTCVCGPRCNNGWMQAKVEADAKPILIPLIRGEECRIFPADQTRIATWAAMKAMVAEWNVKGHATTHYMHRRYLMRHRLPPKNGWGVWIGHFVSNKLKPERERFHPLWAAHPFALSPKDLPPGRMYQEATSYNSQVSTQVIGKLFIHTLRSPMPNLIPRWKFALPDRATLFRIWPPTQTSIVWPGRRMSDLDAIYTDNAFLNFIIGLQRRDSRYPV